ncbi:TPA: type I toxin-antitoxin system Hok family toxin [Providencia rettgeri]|nr:type I toxin-antitoxin system Hok family toxin [Providencia rettgeri]
MAKIALVGLITVCLTVLSFSGMMQKRLCSLSISSGNTLVQATLSCGK